MYSVWSPHQRNHTRTPPLKLEGRCRWWGVKNKPKKFCYCRADIHNTIVVIKRLSQRYVTEAEHHQPSNVSSYCFWPQMHSGLYMSYHWKPVSASNINQPYISLAIVCLTADQLLCKTTVDLHSLPSSWSPAGKLCTETLPAPKCLISYSNHSAFVFLVGEMGWRKSRGGLFILRENQPTIRIIISVQL